jgi:hypothetical protein
MDHGEPGKDLPMLEQTRQADPHGTESYKKMKATTEPTPDALTATTEMVNATFEVTAPVAVQEQFSPGKMDPFEDVPPAELSKVIFFFGDLDCGFSSKYEVINNARFISSDAMLPSLSCILLILYGGLNNLCFLYWKVIQNSFLFQLAGLTRAFARLVFLIFKIFGVFLYLFFSFDPSLY